MARATADELMERMDAEAALAKRELDELIKSNPQAVKLMAAWWNSWYAKAGHKRLGRILAKTVVPTPYADK